MSHVLSLASKFLAIFSAATSDWSTPIIIIVVVVVFSLVARASLVGCSAGDGLVDDALVAVPLCVDLSDGVWLLIEFCRLSVMPRGGPPTSRLWRRLTASPVIGVTFSALSWLFNGGSLHIHTRFICKGQLQLKQLTGITSKAPAHFHHGWKYKCWK